MAQSGIAPSISLSSALQADIKTISVRTTAEAALEVSKALEAGLAQKFEVLGLLSLRQRQIRILKRREELLQSQYNLQFVGAGKEISTDPEPGRPPPIQTAIEDEKSEEALWENWEEYPEELRDDLLKEIDQYYDAILKYRQVLNLPAFKVERKKPGQRRQEFRYLAWTPFSTKLDFTDESNGLVRDFRLFRNKAGKGEYVSLDICTCYDVCPKWYTRIFTLASWTRDNTLRNLRKILLLVVLLLLPAGTILGLYAIPSMWGRLGLIAGESVAVITVLTVLKEYLGDINEVTYMLGLAAIQVVFVGSIIGSK